MVLMRILRVVGCISIQASVVGCSSIQAACADTVRSTGARAVHADLEGFKLVTQRVGYPGRRLGVGAGKGHCG